ncbi:lytic polysaccharide monooxygenase, partial [Pleomassaria siparia CBS 279.74]
ILALAPAVSAHMVMANPVPFGNPNSSPLDEKGSDFPCKMVPGGSTEGTVNEFAVGSSQQLSFTGSAVHGGGSCQLSVTLDNPPTKNSAFKVIYSIEGGCPASANGNFEKGSNDSSGFPFTVPSEVPNGKAVLAWTWFNRIGNREMYMNCAVVNVSGGSDDKAAFESLPDMAIANIPQSTCHTAESSDFTFENPGKYTTRIGSGPFVGLCGGGASAPNSPPVQSAPGMASTVVPVLPPVQTNNAPTTPSITSTVHTVVTVTAPSGTVSNSLAQTPVQAPSQAPAPPTKGGDTSCTTDGAVVCNGESQFGLCNHGQVAWQAVAAGTKCNNGVIQKRDFTHRAQR